MGLWQTWCMRGTENPLKGVRFTWGPQLNQSFKLVVSKSAITIITTLEVNRCNR